MRSKLLGFACRVIALLVLVAPTVALARTNEPERDILDARLEGYPTNVTLESHSTGMTWFLLVILGIVIFAGLFKDAKRSHLD